MRAPPACDVTSSFTLSYSSVASRPYGKREERKKRKKKRKKARKKRKKKKE